MRLILAVAVVVLLLLPRASEASTIGTFDWVHDVLLGTGSVFTVTNASLDPFEDVFVDLFAPGATTPFQSLVFGDIPSGDAPQSTDDLSLLSVPSDIAFAQVRLTYQTLNLTAGLQASDLSGEPTELLQGAVDITDTVPVPEPATLPLVAVAMVLTIALVVRSATT